MSDPDGPVVAPFQAPELRRWLFDRLPGSRDEREAVVETLAGLAELDQPLVITAADRQVAWCLHVELQTRVTTQPLGWRVGDEAAALSSLHSLFPTVRALLVEHGPQARTAGAVAVHLLNRHLRPVTARWHGRLERQGFLHDDDRRRFRLELEQLRQRLVRFQLVLEALFDPEGTGGERDLDISFGVGEEEGEVEDRAGQARRSPLVVDLLPGEEAAVLARRAAFELPPPPAEGPGAGKPQDLVGLALSGGGIRSATFSLGVLQALSQRGLYRHLDYVSTVSGGGYLGSLISAWATGAQPLADKRGGPFVVPGPAADAGAGPVVEPLAIRHVRNHSRTLTDGGLWPVLAPLLAGVVASAAMFYLLCLVLAGLALGLWQLDERTRLEDWSGLLLAGGALLLLPLLQRAWPRGLQVLDRLVSVVVAAGLAFALLPASMAMANGLLRGLGDLGQVDWLSEDLLAFAVPLATSLAALPLKRVLALAPLRRALLAVSPAIALLLVVARLFYYLGEGESLEVLAGLAVGAVVLLMVNDVNLNSLHRFYRDRLARAWCVRPDGAGRVEEAALTLDELSAEHGPVHLVNTTVNLVGARNPETQRELRGRNADFVALSRQGLDSPTLGTWLWSAAEGGRGPAAPTLAGAMAISGAAVGPRLGVLTPAGAGPWLTLLNLRMGFWLHNPRRPAPRWQHPAWGLYLVREAFGWLHEDTFRVNLSDGGHLENLGVFELLRRRCTFVIAIDGEADPQMGFDGLVKLKRYARLDLACEVDLDVTDLQLNAHGLSNSHVALGRLRYHDGSEGRLLYVKLSMTGDEPQELVDYRRRSPTFPHESTADQVYGEEQFEVYRRLGGHVGALLCSELLLGPGAGAGPLEPASWFARLEQALCPDGFPEPPPAAPSATPPAAAPAAAPGGG